MGVEGVDLPQQAMMHGSIGGRVGGAMGRKNRGKICDKRYRREYPWSSSSSVAFSYP